MDKQVLCKLRSLPQEIAQGKERAGRLQLLERALAVQQGADAVRCRREAGQLRDMVLAQLQRNLAEQQAVQRYIESIDDSETRQIMELRYLDGRSWQQVANRMGGMTTADSVRMRHGRFLAREGDAGPVRRAQIGPARRDIEEEGTWDGKQR